MSVGADLGDGRDVDRMVQLSVPAQRQPMDRTATRLERDRCSSRVRGEMMTVGEPADVARVPYHHGGDDRADSEDLGHGRARRGDRSRHRSMR